MRYTRFVVFQPPIVIADREPLCRTSPPAHLSHHLSLAIPISLDDAAGKVASDRVVIESAHVLRLALAPTELHAIICTYCESLTCAFSWPGLCEIACQAKGCRIFFHLWQCLWWVHFSCVPVPSIHGIRNEQYEPHVSYARACALMTIDYRSHQSPKRSHIYIHLSLLGVWSCLFFFQPPSLSHILHCMCLCM